MIIIRKQNKDKPATKRAQFEPIGIPTFLWYNLVPNLNSISYPRDTIKRHIHSDKTKVYTLYGL